MIVNIYAIYDRLAEQYAKPMFLQAKVAKRNFDWMAKENSAENCTDKEIHELGVWNDETGEIISHAPTKVYDLEQAQKEYEGAKA